MSHFSLGEMWVEASRDLKIRVVVPFTLETRQYPVLVCDFGSPNGLVVLEDWDESLAEFAQARGFGFSCMYAGPYDRDDIIDALQDWGWARTPSDAPDWYVDEPYSTQR